MKEECKRAVIEFPEGADSFQEGIILIDEAVSRFMDCEGDEVAKLLEIILASIVISFSPESDDVGYFDQNPRSHC